jgi:hypothetical protein
MKTGQTLNAAGQSPNRGSGAGIMKTIANRTSYKSVMNQLLFVRLWS